MAVGDAVGDAVAALHERLSLYPPERYPIQHATAQFHLGAALLGGGRPHAAVSALRAAVDLFPADRLPVEHAKARNQLGAALRAVGRLDAAAACFVVAAEAFAGTGLAREEGAARYNLGLVHRDRGDDATAASCFEAARLRFRDAGATAAEGAAARELGAARFALGALAAAAEALQEAVALAGRGRDQAGVGGAANVLGLVRLAEGDGTGAADAFADALAAHPRTVRPGEHAMVKANLALAYELIGDQARARLVARQAHDTRAAPPPVRAQATAVLERLGHGGDALRAVLAAEPLDRWAPLVREELARWQELGEDAVRAEAAAWFAQQAQDPQAEDLAEAWLGALLELPPDELERLLGAGLAALPGLPADTADQARSQLQRALPRFHLPQMVRLRDTLNRLAAEQGLEARWT